MILLARIHVLHPQQNSSFKYGDLTITEGEEQPWENMFYKVPGSHRFKFLLASSRGLVEGQRNIKTISLHTLSLYLAKASAIGQGSERSAEVNTVMLRHAEDIGKEYIACLMRGIAEEWDTEMDERSPNETLTINTYSREILP
ncbi:hypothetical protein BDQ17DRAFT_154601 [Cyathus striatus]|nr:hypothetical protein BDQ17DRAFT_154601 [Cyathus striatus]